MNRGEVANSLPPNREARSAHRRQAWLQIYLPVGAALLIALGLAVLVCLSANGQVYRWATVSIAFLGIPALLVGLAGLALLILGVALLARILRSLAAILRWPQLFTQVIAQRVRAASDRAAAPLIAVGGFFAAWRAFIKWLYRLK
jgi:hypothetical protein